MVDEQLHKQTQYRIKYLHEQFEEANEDITNFVWLGDNWNSYGAKAFER